MQQIDGELIQAFEDQLDPGQPEKSRMRAEVLGYGEISCVLRLEALPEMALKRMPPFPTAQSLSSYQTVVDDYCRLLQASGISPVDYGFCQVRNARGEHILYIAQPAFPPHTIGNTFLAKAGQDQFERAVRAVVGQLVDFWAAPRSNGLQLGIDAQISNWVFRSSAASPLFLDYSTPFIRRNGIEQLNTEIFLQSMPGPLVPLVRRFFLQEILDRYYSLRLVLIDLLANFLKENLRARLPETIALINTITAESKTAGDMPPLTAVEIEKYYKSDAAMWALLLALRKTDRFVKTKLLRRRYNFILPGKIAR